MKKLKTLLASAAALLDLLFVPFTFISLVWLYAMRRIGNSRLPLQRRLYQPVGIYPLRDHYYEPMYNFTRLRRSLREDRRLAGIDWNEAEQLQLLQTFTYADELRQIPTTPTGQLSYYHYNDTFGPGDGEFLYNIIRHFKPTRFVEIGSGNSTLMTIQAIRANTRDNSAYVCDHVCIEPYENPWLAQLNVRLIRDLVENVDRSVFDSLERGSILFIDSSHIIRPQGDVLTEYLEILPRLKPGVLVHVHDIFSPKDYLDHWLRNDLKFWNEQYLLEAFLSFNKDFRIIGAVNWLKHRHGAHLFAACPIVGARPESVEPGSFWMMRNEAR